MGKLVNWARHRRRGLPLLIARAVLVAATLGIHHWADSRTDPGARSEREWLRLLASPDEDSRVSAVMGLAYHAPALPWRARFDLVYRVATEDPDYNVRAHAVDALRRLGEGPQAPGEDEMVAGVARLTRLAARQPHHFSDTLSAIIAWRWTIQSRPRTPQTAALIRRVDNAIIRAAIESERDAREERECISLSLLQFASDLSLAGDTISSWEDLEKVWEERQAGQGGPRPDSD